MKILPTCISCCSWLLPGLIQLSILPGHALEDLSLDDIDINSIDKELDRDNDTNSLSSSLSAGLSTSGKDDF